MENYNKLKDLVQGAEFDADKFFNRGNKSAGTRLRKAMQEIKKTAQEVRIAVSEKKKK